MQKYNVDICQREIRRHVVCGLSPRFPADMNDFARRESFQLSDLEAEVAQVESFQTDFERKFGGTPALASTHLGDGKSQRGYGQGSATRGGKKRGKHHGGVL